MGDGVLESEKTELSYLCRKRHIYNVQEKKGHATQIVRAHEKAMNHDHSHISPHCGKFGTPNKNWLYHSCADP